MGVTTNIAGTSLEKFNVGKAQLNAEGASEHIVNFPNESGTIALKTKWPMVCDTVDTGETVTIPERYQLIIANQINNSGTIYNDGVLYIL